MLREMCGWVVQLAPPALVQDPTINAWLMCAARWPVGHRALEDLFKDLPCLCKGLPFDKHGCSMGCNLPEVLRVGRVF